MAKREEFRLDERDEEACRAFWDSYNLDDEDDHDHYAFSLMTLGLFLAQESDPYRVIGVLDCTINHIYKSLEEDDE